MPIGFGILLFFIKVAMKDKTPEITRAFDSLKDITPQILKEYNIKGILTDLDDTLVTHNYPIPTEEVKTWLSTLKKEGIGVCLISNNQKKRMMSFVKDIDVGYFYNAFKPRIHVINSAVSVLNLKKDEVVFIGDQLFTDVRAANRAEIRAFLVKPIGTKSTLFIKFKRKLERKILK